MKNYLIYNEAESNCWFSDALEVLIYQCKLRAFRYHKTQHFNSVLIYCFVVLCSLTSVAHTSPVAIPVGSLLKATFTQQRHLTGIPKPIISKGEMLLWGEKGLLWATETPFPDTILITPKGIYHLENGKRTLIKSSSRGCDGDAFTILSKILDGNFSQIKEFQQNSAYSKHGKWKTSLVPTAENLKKIISSIIVEGDKYISRIIIERANGDKSDIIINNQEILSGASIGQALKVKQMEWFDD